MRSVWKCRTMGASAESAVACGDFQATSSRKRTFRNTMVYLRYRLAANGREYDSFVHVFGGKKAFKIATLNAGDRWLIMAHDDEPLKISAG